MEGSPNFSAEIARSVAEPYLYRHLVLGFDWVILEMLLFTLIDRPQLALHVKSFEFKAELLPKLRSEETIGDAHRKLWNKADAVRALMDSVIGDDSGSCYMAQQKNIWFGQLFFQSAYDPVLATLLYLAKNLERLVLSEPENAVFMALRSLFVLDWPDERRPMKKLQYLSTSGCHTESMPPQFILPSMVALHIRECAFDPLPIVRPTIPSPMYPDPNVAALRTLVLKEVAFTITSLEHILSSPSTRKVSCIRIRRCWEPDESALMDLTSTSRVLEKNTPALECFEFSGHCENDAAIVGFDTFKELKKLKELHVDIRLFQEVGLDTELEILATAHELFPESLESLHLDWVRLSDIEFESSKALKDIEDGCVPMYSTFGPLFPLPHLKNITLSLACEQDDDDQEDDIELLQLQPETVYLLRSVADEYSNDERIFKVYHAPGENTRYYNVSDWTELDGTVATRNT